MVETTPEEIQNALVGYIEENFLVKFGADGFFGNTNYFEAGIVDSYGMIELFNFLETTWGLALTDEDMLSPSLSSVDGVVALVSERM